MTNRDLVPCPRCRAIGLKQKERCPTCGRWWEWSPIDGTAHWTEHDRLFFLSRRFPFLRLAR
jgi:hypothetical protein